MGGRGREGTFAGVREGEEHSLGGGLMGSRVWGMCECARRRKLHNRERGDNDK